MNNLTSLSEELFRHKSGPVLRVAFGGKYPPGSDGNGFAAEMVDYLRSVLAVSNASAILFDLRNLDYAWGDAICGLALALRKDRVFRPSAIVAGDHAARALEPLVGPRTVFGIAGM